MINRLNRSVVFGSFASAFALFAPAAFAQDAQTSDDQGRQVEEIVVTAQRKNESLVEVPVSITAISADSLSKQAISTERDLQIAVPGLTVRAAFSSDQLNYSLRGQTIDPFTYSQPGVVPYVNDYAVPAGYASAPLYDLQSVQVLKGPQGTLFGRNAIGGAVLFTTAKPTHDFGSTISTGPPAASFRRTAMSCAADCCSDATSTLASATYKARRSAISSAERSMPRMKW